MQKYIKNNSATSLASAEKKHKVPSTSTYQDMREDRLHLLWSLLDEWHHYYHHLFHQALQSTLIQAKENGTNAVYCRFHISQPLATAYLAIVFNCFQAHSKPLL